VCADEITKQLKCSEDKKRVLGHGEKRQCRDKENFSKSQPMKSLKAVYTIIRLLVQRDDRKYSIVGTKSISLSQQNNNMTHES
jgi:hypothetical protein